MKGMPPGMPGMPAGQVDPAAAPQAKGGQEARGKVLAGLATELVRIAIPMFPKESPMGIALAETAAKLGRIFAKPPEDLGQAELKFMGQQLYPGQKPGPDQAMNPGRAQAALAGAGVPAAGGAPPQPGG